MINYRTIRKKENDFGIIMINYPTIQREIAYWSRVYRKHVQIFFHVTQLFQLKVLRGTGKEVATQISITMKTNILHRW